MSPDECDDVKALYKVAGMEPDRLDRVLEILTCDPDGLRALHINDDGRVRIAGALLRLGHRPNRKNWRKK